MRQANTTYVNLRAHARRARPVRRGVEAGGAQAAALPRRAAAVRARGGARRCAACDGSSAAPGPTTTCSSSSRTYPPLAEIAPETPKRLRHRQGAARAARSRSWPRRSGTARRSWRTAGPTPSTSSAGWTTSRTPAPTTRSAASRASQTYFNAFSLRRRAARRSAASSRSERPRRGVQASSRGPRQVKRCPGASEEPAPDGSNVFSEEEQRELDCVEAAPSDGADRMRRPPRCSSIVLPPASPRSWSPGAGDADDALKTYEIEFDNAFGLVEGGDLKIGGVKAGQTTGFELTETQPYRVDRDRRGHRARLRLAAQRRRVRRAPAVADRRVLRRLRPRHGEARSCPTAAACRWSSTSSTIPPDLIQHPCAAPTASASG